MWVLLDMAGDHAYTEGGDFVEFHDKSGWQNYAAKFQTEDEAERVRFVLRWAKQCYLQVKEVR